MTDLAQLDTAAGANAGFDFTLRNPATGEDLDITIRLLGRDADVFIGVQHQQLKNRLERVRRAGRQISISPEDVDRESVETLTACTIGWQNVVMDGQTVAFSKKAAMDLYTRFRWIREQVDQAIGDRANFTKPPATASSASPATSSNSTES